MVSSPVYSALGRDFNAPWPYLMMKLPWGEIKRADLGLAETGLRGSGSDVGGQSSGGRGEWPGTLTGPSSHPTPSPAPGNIYHMSQTSGIRGQGVRPATDTEAQTNEQRNDQCLHFARLKKNFKVCWSLFTKITQTPVRWRLWCDVTSVTLSRGGQRSDHSKARELLRQYKPRDIEDNRVLSSNHKVTSATSYKMTSRVSSLFCEGLSPVTALSSWIRSLPPS